MEQLVKEKEEAAKVAEGLEEQGKALGEAANAHEKKTSELERDISSLEGSLDDTMTATMTAHDKLDVASKTASDAELEVSALVRRIQLLDEETARVNERLTEVLEKLPAVEKCLEENERQRKVFEAKSFSNEEKSELMETQLTEATQIAEESHRKMDDVTRKLRMVEDDLGRVVDRAEEYEAKIQQYEATLAGDAKK